MAVTRRSFLIGAGSIITAAFVKEAFAFGSDTQMPMPTRHIAWLVDAPYRGETIFYERVEDHWRLHWGQPQFEIPEPQLLIENLRFHGHNLRWQRQIDAFCDETGWTEEALFSPMDAASWEDQWEHNLSPEAQAFTFLEKHGIFPAGSAGLREGQVVFESYPNPMSNARWVEVHDPVTLTLLQARLNELGLGPMVRPFE
jgi:hypothetical protein